VTFSLRKLGDVIGVVCSIHAIRDRWKVVLVLIEAFDKAIIAHLLQLRLLLCNLVHVKRQVERIAELLHALLLLPSFELLIVDKTDNLSLCVQAFLTFLLLHDFCRL